VEYQAELKQVSEAEPTSSPDEQRKRVISELVSETLLAQAAFKGGFSLDDQALQARLDQLAEQAGGAQALADWQTRMGFTPDSFKSALRRSAAAAWQRDQLINAIPAEMEQVHARQILVQSEKAASQAEQQAKQAGTDFATLAFGYDLKTGGDLSWFPRGYLNETAVEEAAFALQPGEISPVIKSSIGYHIVQVIARQVRPLSPDARLVLQRKALAQWLDDSRKQSQIEELVP
jgi:peptidyl-prolyl cis-trans isomerase C